MTKTFILEKPPGITEQAKIPWEQIVSDLMSLRGTTDKCQEQMGEKAARAKQMYGHGAIAKLAIECYISKKALYEHVKVVETFTKSFRDEYRRMSFSHFRVCCHQKWPEEWLAAAHDNNWTVENLVMEIANSKPTEEPEPKLCPSCGYKLD
jgi:hypothetical protein